MDKARPFARHALPWWWALCNQLPKSFDVSKQHITKAGHLFHDCTFVRRARRRFEFPEQQKGQSPLPEVAFIGQPNSGKSSLLKGMFREGVKVVVSKNEHCTKLAWFYGIKTKFFVIDLPGFTNAQSLWCNQINREVMQRRPWLKTVLFLVPADKGMDDADREQIEHCEKYHVPYTFVITKCDLATESQLRHVISDVKGVLKDKWKFRAFKEVFLTSATEGIGLDELKCYIAARCGLL